jgi:hypothetical protein
MPLDKITERYFGPGLDGIRFQMRDGDKEVCCSVSLEALGERSNQTGLTEAEVFETFRCEIEAAASEKYDRGHADSAGCVSLSSDEFPPQRRI